MARSALAAQSISSAGLTPVYTAANVLGHTLVNTGSTILCVLNSSVADIDVTLQTPATLDGNAVAENVVTVPAGEEKRIGRLSPRAYNRPSGAADAGLVYVDFSDVTTVTVALIEP